MALFLQIPQTDCTGLVSGFARGKRIECDLAVRDEIVDLRIVVAYSVSRN